MTLTEFLTARLDEDEAVARKVDDDFDDMSRPTEIYYEGYHGYGEIVTIGTGYLMADVEAKRRIVATYAAHEAEPMSSDQGFHNCGDQCIYAAMDWTLAVLALPYAGHPDYDEAWRP